MQLKDAERLARELIQQHCPEFTFRWNNRRSFFGMCWTRDKVIELSRHLTKTESEEGVRGTILHEIAHALTGNHHGATWKAMCRKLGCRPSATREATGPVQYKYLLVFGDEVIAGYHRLPRRDVSKLYLHGRREETLGKLKIVVAA